MKKSGIIVKLIYMIFISVFLMYVFARNDNILVRIAIIPFLVCSLSAVGMTIFSLLHKKENVATLNKVYMISFLVYVFGFLIVWCYMNIRDNNYILLLFSIPFWITGIYIAKKYLLGTKRKASCSSVNIKKIGSIFLVGVCFFLGVMMLFLGIKSTDQVDYAAQDYVITNGYFYDYIIDDYADNSTTYKLIYTYQVNDQSYTVTTNNTTNYIPEHNSIKEVKYNPYNPSESILVDSSHQKGLIYMGCFFILGSLTFVLGWLSVLGYFDKLKIDIVGLYLGIVFLMVGIGIIVYQNGITFSFMETIKSFGLWILIPCLFIGVGLFQLIKCMFFTRQRSKKAK